MKRLLREARAGDAESQFNLGVFYVNGQDDNGHPIRGNAAESMKWLLAAAEQGLPRAQIKLAEAYAGQPSKAGSLAKAYFWFLLAQNRLDGIHRERAQAGCKRASGAMTAAELATATRLAGLWKPSLRNVVPAVAAPAGRQGRIEQ
jgi:TPR repeat protein